MLPNPAGPKQRAICKAGALSIKQCVDGGDGLIGVEELNRLHPDGPSARDARLVIVDEDRVLSSDAELSTGQLVDPWIGLATPTSWE